MKKFLKLIAENTPSNSEYEIVLRGTDGDVGSVKLSGTSYAFDLFQDIKTIIKLGENIEIPVEDNETGGILDSEETDALKIASDLVKDPKRRVVGFDPKKRLQKALGDMYNKVATKVMAVAEKI
tara:strand:- start:5 stop:376 length:372 start_codon:yes stop_codon:yes gene_type:complete